MRKIVYATILTSGTINAIGGLGGPFKGLTFLDTINEAIRSEKLPVQFHTEDGNPAVTLQLKEDKDNVLMKAHDAVKYQQEGILYALKLKGFELMENGYVKPCEVKEETNEESLDVTETETTVEKAEGIEETAETAVEKEETNEESLDVTETETTIEKAEGTKEIAETEVSTQVQKEEVKTEVKKQTHKNGKNK